MINPFRIDGQRAVVTGGGSGLGLGIAKVFIEAGAEVVIIGRNEEKLQKAQQQLGKQCSYRAFDVTQTDQIPALVQEIGAVDILVNCAGTHLKKWALDVSDAEFLDVMNVHVMSVFTLSREFAKGMVERGKGNIIMISSMAALMGLEQIVAYTTAKTAILGLQRSLVAELSPKGIRINTIAPGWIDTPMFHKATDNDPQRKTNILRRIPMKTFGQPEDIGYAALYLSSPAGSYVNGVFLPVDAGASEAF
ncbi:MAG: SDR family oxidoreductase [Prevotella sp.]|nr:SDR family oxidoreductase [Prevotella sp.]